LTLRRPLGEHHRQRDVVGCAFGTDVVEERKAPAVGIVEPIPDFTLLAEHDRERAVDECGESGKSKSAVLTWTSRPPARRNCGEHVRVRRAHEGARPP